jgi:hypothetical protein
MPFSSTTPILLTRLMPKRRWFRVLSLLLLISIAITITAVADLHTLRLQAYSLPLLLWRALTYAALSRFIPIKYVVAVVLINEGSTFYQYSLEAL